MIRLISSIDKILFIRYTYFMLKRICPICKETFLTEHPRRKYHPGNCKKQAMKDQFSAWRQRAKKQAFLAA